MIPIFDCPPATFKPRITRGKRMRLNDETGKVEEHQMVAVVKRRGDFVLFDTLGEACAHIREVVR